MLRNDFPPNQITERKPEIEFCDMRKTAQSGKFPDKLQKLILFTTRSQKLFWAHPHWNIVPLSCAFQAKNNHVSR